MKQDWNKDGLTEVRFSQFIVHMRYAQVVSHTNPKNSMKDYNGCPCAQYVAMPVDNDLNLNI